MSTETKTKLPVFNCGGREKEKQNNRLQDYYPTPRQFEEIKAGRVKKYDDRLIFATD